MVLEGQPNFGFSCWRAWRRLQDHSATRAILARFFHFRGSGLSLLGGKCAQTINWLKRDDNLWSYIGERKIKW